MSQSDPLPNGGVDLAGRCLKCGFKVESSAACRCETRAAFDAMCEEQREEYDDYERTPIRIVPLDDSVECVGCGNEKRHRGRPVESIVCCGECWRKLPKWARHAFCVDQRRPASGPEHGPTIWQGRLSVLLQWMRETA